MRLAILGFAVLPLGAQVLIPADRIPKPFLELESSVVSDPLKCDMIPVKPRLDYGFRFQTGYLIRVPLNQYSGPKHYWAMLTRITPEGGEPVNLLNVVSLPDILPTRNVGEAGGMYLVGEGRYQVQQFVVDDLGRGCKKEWRVEARRTRAERNMTIRIPPNTVEWLGSRRLHPDSNDERPYRLTLLMHAAPLWPRNLKIRPFELGMLLGSLGPLMDQLPSVRIRLVVFNLDQQKVLFESGDFSSREVGPLARSIQQVELGTVNYSVIQNPSGPFDLLLSLVKHEVEEKDRSDAVIFLGPPSRYLWKIPESVLPERSEKAPLFFDLRYSPQVARGSEFPDVIQNIVRSQKGKTYIVHSPGEFATALTQIGNRLESKLSARETP